MKTIYKYTLSNEACIRPQVVEMPWVCEIINVVKKSDGVFLYALVETETGTDCRRKFRVYGTGWQIKEENIKYINSFLIDDYEIYHVFEVLD